MPTKTPFLERCTSEQPLKFIRKMLKFNRTQISFTTEFRCFKYCLIQSKMSTLEKSLCVYTFYELKIDLTYVKFT